jgi:SnoaL-like domain
MDINEIVTRYLAVWNETDVTAREAALAEVLAENVTYTDPLATVTGREAFSALIGGVQEQFGGLTFSLYSGIDAHHNIARFQWALGPEGGEALAVGADAIAVDEQGRVTTVLGFLDKVPAGVLG